VFKKRSFIYEGILVAEKAELQSKLHQAMKKIDKKQDECDELSGRLKGKKKY